MCSEHVHSTVTRASPFHCLTGVINKPTTVELCISPSGVGTMGQGVYCTPPQVQDLYPLYPQVKDAAYVKILNKRL